ncbi:hypothetical protein ACP26L_01185 [Paenibacillus sp. S-38]|uniref:hypothetical protein n=1 Tax=Paenibacillus sp. S-38 TaxID=3416710 RepID=UPI003CF405F8
MKPSGERSMPQPLVESDYAFLLTDPRPDLEKDSKLWSRLIRECIFLPDRRKALELSFRLWTIRSIGTIIRWTHHGSRLEPILLSPDSAWPSQEFYDEMKDKYLKPYAAEIRTLLLKVTTQ